jgi:hypothetical protein
MNITSLAIGFRQGEEDHVSARNLASLQIYTGSLRALYD